MEKTFFVAIKIDNEIEIFEFKSKKDREVFIKDIENKYPDAEISRSEIHFSKSNLP